MLSEELARRAALDELQKSLMGQWPMVDDAVITVLTAKTSAQVLSGDGKQNLRAEVKTAINKVFERAEPNPASRPHVLAVYLVDYMLQ
jgi:flagellar basal body-associated protein FliL